MSQICRWTRKRPMPPATWTSLRPCGFGSVCGKTKVRMRHAAERQAREAAGVIPCGQAAELFSVVGAGKLAHERLDRDPERAARAEGERLRDRDEEIAVGGEQRRSRKSHHEKASAQRAALAESIREGAAAEADDELDQNRQRNEAADRHDRITEREAVERHQDLERAHADVPGKTARVQGDDARACGSSGAHENLLVGRGRSVGRL